MKERINRREFLKTSATILTGAFISGCSRKIEKIFELVESVNPKSSELISEPTEEPVKEIVVLPTKIEKLLNLAPNYSFDTKGNLTLKGAKVELETPLSLSEKVKKVTAIIIHYDGASPNYSDNSGKLQRRTPVLTKRWGLDPRGLSMHWCVGNGLPDNNDGTSVLQTMEASGDPFLPFKRIAPPIANLEVRVKKITETGNSFEKVGIVTPKWITYASSEGLRNYSVGFEQVGSDFNKSFPSMMPPDQQVSNVLGLTVACMKQWNLGPWDVIGHNEINNEKADPGSKYMAIMRILIGSFALKHKAKERKLYGFIFGKEKPVDYFSKVLKYYFLVNPNDNSDKSVLEIYLPINQLVKSLGY
ncbi:MAG: N-acetylmuramoyl-L-alanine amidase [Patescibacteria group bacterium]